MEIIIYIKFVKYLLGLRNSSFKLHNYEWIVELFHCIFFRFFQSKLVFLLYYNVISFDLCGIMLLSLTHILLNLLLSLLLPASPLLLSNDCLFSFCQCTFV